MNWHQRSMCRIGSSDLDTVPIILRRFGSSRRLFVGWIAFAIVLSVSVPKTSAATNEFPKNGPRILVLRGLFEVFSLGMNELAQKLRQHGYDAEVTSWTLALDTIDCSDPRPLVVIGHSMGGRMCATVARKYQKCGRKVPLIIIVDSNLNQTIPSNVETCINLYVTNELGVFHGSPVQPEVPGMKIINWDISRGTTPWYQGGVNHFDIDATDWVHQIIIKNVDAVFQPAKRPNIKSLVDMPNRSFGPANTNTNPNTKPLSAKQVSVSASADAPQFRMPSFSISSREKFLTEKTVERAPNENKANRRADSLRWQTPWIPESNDNPIGSKWNSTDNRTNRSIELTPDNSNWIRAR